MVGLKFGADWLLDGAVGLAEQAGMSKEMIGVTIVAFGTSVPELVASGVAAFRQQTDISIGNLIGSNIFNIMVVIGVTSIIKEVAVTDTILANDMLWMIGIAIILLPMMLIGKKMGRPQGMLLFLGYAAYIGLAIASV